ncbi:hypothetical protein BH18ACT11_BH18ACT11_11100 [soil metagenome]
MGPAHPQHHLLLGGDELQRLHAVRFPLLLAQHRKRLLAVLADEEAQDLRFPGSPTIRVDGEDLFPVPDRPRYALGCRTYATPEGLKGSPTATMLRAALAERNLVPEVS